MALDGNGFSNIDVLKTKSNDTPIVILSGYDNPKVALDAVQVGVQEYLLKENINSRVLGLSVRSSIARKSYENKLIKLASNDELTGLMNRRAFEIACRKSLNRAKRHNRNIAVFFIDLDNFKKVNDYCGHDSGDIVLKRFGEILLSSVRDSDLVCRMGGDEFALLIEEYSDIDDLNVIASKILHEMKTEKQFYYGDFSVSASIGASCYPQSSTSLEQLMIYADQALYSIKRSGKNGFQLYGEKVKDEINTKEKIEDEVSNGLNYDDFDVSYQTIIETKTNEVVGIETYCRWIAKGFNDIGPNVFIPILEEQKLISDLGRIVLRKSLKLLMQLEKEYPGIFLSINFSTDQFIEDNVTTLVTEMLNEFEIEPERLSIDLSESQILKYYPSILPEVECLCKLGVKVYIDDFGSTATTINILNLLNITGVKIDNQYLTKHTAHSKNKYQKMLKSLAGIANSYNVNVIAEGIETNMQKSFYIDSGVSTQQGFLYSKPKKNSKK